MHIQPHSQARNHGGEGMSSLPCFENQKKYPDLGKKGPDFVHLLVKFFVQNVILRVTTRKNSKMFHCGAFFSCVLTNCLLKCLSSQPSPLLP